MKSFGAIRALKEANKSQSRLIEKLTTRNKALEGVVEDILKPINNIYQEIDDHVEIRTGCVTCANDMECEPLNALTHVLKINLLALRKALAKLEEI